MKQIILISGATATGKTNIATRIARAVDGILLPIDQLQMYWSLEVGTNLDISAFKGIFTVGYQSQDPWHRLKPEEYVSWLLFQLSELSQTKTVIIEGCSTTFITELLAQSKSDPLLQNTRIMALAPYGSDRHRRQKIKDHYDEARVRAISEEVGKLHALKLFDETGLPLFEKCESTMVQPDCRHEGLAWALRAAASVYYPAYLLLVGKSSLKAVRDRIVENVFNIQSYQNEYLHGLIDEKLFFSNKQPSAIHSFATKMTV